VAYLPQQLEEQDLSLSLGSFLLPAAHDLIFQMRCVEERMAAAGSCARELEAAYASLFERFERAGGYLAQARLERTLAGLGLNALDLERPLASLSGGQRARLALARVLIVEADLLLLDEPTNNIDVAVLEWLERAIAENGAACLIVSHDRRFLDRATNCTFEIAPGTGRLTEYGGNYSWYRERKRQDEERRLREFNEQHKRIRKLKADIEATRQQAQHTERATQNDYLRGRSKKVAAKAKARESRMGKMLEAHGQIEKPVQQQRMRLDLAGRKLFDKTIFCLRDGRLERGGVLLFDGLNLEVLGSARVALTGENGSGKTSLLKALLGELPLSAGSAQRSASLKCGYLGQDDDQLPGDNSVLQFFLDAVADGADAANYLQEGNARTFLNRFLFAGDQVFQPISQLSRGERTKLRLAIFMALQVDLLILDEPTNHLDLPGLECLEEALNQFRGALIVVSHDRYFLDRINLQTVWKVEDRRVRVLDPD
ncbi:MAG TPA: ABC-F family ATP-binding cassette domain-containing protein, partial [Chroococcales cyanobacterium]